MKKKIKLDLNTLEKELQKLPTTALYEILGGNGDPNDVYSQIMNGDFTNVQPGTYTFNSDGTIDFTSFNDSNANWHVIIEEVLVTANGNNNSNPNPTFPIGGGTTAPDITTFPYDSSILNPNELSIMGVTGGAGSPGGTVGSVIFGDPSNQVFVIPGEKLEEFVKSQINHSPGLAHDFMYYNLEDIPLAQKKTLWYDNLGFDYNLLPEDLVSEYGRTVLEFMSSPTHPNIGDDILGTLTALNIASDHMAINAFILGIKELPNALARTTNILGTVGALLDFQEYLETGDEIDLLQGIVWAGATLARDARVKIALTAIGLGLNIYEILRDKGVLGSTTTWCESTTIGTTIG